MDQRQRNDLDNYITGHYGEDQFKEEEFFVREQAKIDKRWLRMLRKVNRTGFAGRETIETLLVNGYCIISPPEGCNPLQQSPFDGGWPGKIEGT